MDSISGELLCGRALKEVGPERRSGNELAVKINHGRLSLGSRGLPKPSAGRVVVLRTKYFRTKMNECWNDGVARLWNQSPGESEDRARGGLGGTGGTVLGSESLVPALTHVARTVKRATPRCRRRCSVRLASGSGSGSGSVVAQVAWDWNG